MTIPDQSIHFHSRDSRFCGSKQIARQFTLDENAVTCEPCKDNDRLWLSPEGVRAVAIIASNARAERENKR